jgi:hypothetical protein
MVPDLIETARGRLGEGAEQILIGTHVTEQPKRLYVARGVAPVRVSCEYIKHTDQTASERRAAERGVEADTPIFQHRTVSQRECGHGLAGSPWPRLFPLSPIALSNGIVGEAQAW